MSSFLKLQDRLSGNARGNVHWHRASRDGAPFRGNHAPLLREEEYEQIAERVHDTYARQFDASNPEHMAELQKVYELWSNGLATVHCHDRQFSSQRDAWIIYIVWSIPFMEVPQEKIANIGASGPLPGVSSRFAG